MHIEYFRISLPFQSFRRSLTPIAEESIEVANLELNHEADNKTTSSLELVSTVSISKNTPHIIKKQEAVTWESALEKGKKLWAAHQEKLLADNPKEKHLTINLLKSKYQWVDGSPEHQANPVNSLRGSLGRDGIKTEPIWQRSQLKEKGKVPMSDFENYYFYDQKKTGGCYYC